MWKWSAIDPFENEKSRLFLAVSLFVVWAAAVFSGYAGAMLAYSLTQRTTAENNESDH